MTREAVKFAGTAGPVVLPVYPGTGFVYSDPIDCENFLQICFELYPGTMSGALYYTLEFSSDDLAPLSDAGWLPDAVDGADSVTGTDDVVVISRLVRSWAGSGPIQLNTPISHRWVRLGLAAGTSGTAMAIVDRVSLASE